MLSYILTIGVISLLTLTCIMTIFLAAFVRLWKSPPVFIISAEGLPSEFTLIQQRLPAKVETEKPDVIPLPENILTYIALESEEFAQESRKRRARQLYADSQNWDVVFRQMQKEDSPFQLGVDE